MSRKAIPRGGDWAARAIGGLIRRRIAVIGCHCGSLTSGFSSRKFHTQVQDVHQSRLEQHFVRTIPTLLLHVVLILLILVLFLFIFIIIYLLLIIPIIITIIIIITPPTPPLSTANTPAPPFISNLPTLAGASFPGHPQPGVSPTRDVGHSRARPNANRLPAVRTASP